MDAMIADIQKFSLHDGPGIRTTVFFKGCNMHCIWCHNPEAISFQRDLLFFSSKCIHCGACFAACRTGALTMEDRQRNYRKDLCLRCGLCSDACAPGALKIAGQRMSVEEVMRSVLEDLDYFTASGGGVTLSGGEVLMQVDFAAELLQRCRAEGINTAVETNLSLPFEIVQKLVPWLDRVYCDIKLMDEEKHVFYTGVSNRCTLDNIVRLSDAGIPLVIRTPLIPGITDSPENIVAIAAWIRSNANAEYYELLNYNPLAEAKAEELGTAYLPGHLKRKTKQELKDLAALAEKEGIPVTVGDD